MNYVLVHHKVRDFEQWKPAYESHARMREQAGLKEVRVLHAADDANDVTLLFEVKDLAKAQQFADSSDLKEAMQKAGVVGKPEITYLRN